MKNLAYTIALFSLALFVTSCGSEERKTIEESPAIAVKVSQVGADKLESYVSASGKIEAESSANLSTRMMGYVTSLPVKVGQQVTKGTLLLSINSADLQAKKAQVEASIIQAKAGYENAKKDYERFQTLFEQGSASQKELDDMTTRYKVAEAGKTAAESMKSEVEAQFSYAAIRAPFSGTITNTFVKEGDMANPGMPLLSIESSGKPQVVAMVAESSISSIEEGMPVMVQIKSLGKTISGEVIEVSQSAKNTGGQYLVKVNLTEQDDSLLSGMFVNVRFPLTSTEKNENSSAVLVLVSALVTNGQLTGIYTVGSEKTAILRWLRIGKTIGDQVEVLSGLASDESYITSAEGRLYNGVNVTIN
jgi:RND family efflux transporter MFP subunit